MGRLLFLILLSLAIPLVTYLAYTFVRPKVQSWRLPPGAKIITVNPPLTFVRSLAQWPWFRLFLAGVCLLAIMLLTLRIIDMSYARTEWQPANPAVDWSSTT